MILREIGARLGFLVDVGLDYLTVDRTSSTLSGGEAQRIRLATQIGSSLVGVLYILDEPTIGLHQKDNARLIATLIRLRDIGNTLLVVEHDEETIRIADWVVDIGPGGRRARRRGHRERAAVRGARRAALDHRGVPARRAPGARPRAAPGGQRQGPAGARGPRAQPQGPRRRASRWRRSRRSPASPARASRRSSPTSSSPRSPRPSAAPGTGPASTTRSRAGRRSTRSSRSTRARSGGRRAPTRRRTRASSGPSASCSRACPRHACAATGPAASAST